MNGNTLPEIQEKNKRGRTSNNKREILSRERSKDNQTPGLKYPSLRQSNQTPLPPPIMTSVRDGGSSPVDMEKLKKRRKVSLTSKLSPLTSFGAVGNVYAK